MRYCGISLFRTLASTTSALWPAEPTADVAHLMSLGCACDQAAEVGMPIAAATANVVRIRLSMTLPLFVFIQGRAGHHPTAFAVRRALLEGQNRPPNRLNFRRKKMK